jgi:hypothetical protein
MRTFSACWRVVLTWDWKRIDAACAGWEEMSYILRIAETLSENMRMREMGVVNMGEVGWFVTGIGASIDAVILRVARVFAAWAAAASASISASNHATTSRDLHMATAAVRVFSILELARLIIRHCVHTYSPGELFGWSQVHKPNAYCLNTESRNTLLSLSTTCRTLSPLALD